MPAVQSGMLRKGVIVCELEWLFLTGSDCLRWGVIVYGRVLLSAVGSGCMQEGVVVCGREWLFVVGNCGLQKGALVYGRE